jgi:hypothetical protein
LVSVPFHRSNKTGNLLIATLPNNSAVLIPGYYLLFILTADRVPSEGRFVHICRAKGRSSRDADRDLWRRIVDLLEHVRNMPAQLDRLELEFGIKGAAGHADIEHDGDAACRPPLAALARLKPRR